jgi:HK97 family phage prohead protease
MKELKDVILSKACPEPELEFKRDTEDAEDSGRISGYASVFNNVDLQGDVIRPGAYTQTIKERVAGGKVPLMTRHFAYGGDTSEAIGLIDFAEERKKGLWISAKLFNDPSSQSAREKVKSAPNAWGMSVGFKTIKSADVRSKDGEVTGKELLALALYEVTLTLVPANPKTDASAKTETGEEAIAQPAGGSTVLPARPKRTSALLKRRIALLKYRR